MKKVIAVDFDGTLAHYSGYKGPGVPLEPVLNCQPIPLMVEKVKRWLEEGHEVVIFTARLSVSHLDLETMPRDKMAALVMNHASTQRDLDSWCILHGLPRLQSTSEKWPTFTEIWDDRAVAVRRNTGLGWTPPPDGYNYMLVKSEEALTFSAPKVK